nr:hypothetical protein [uncultured Blautia sp.]
MTKFRFSLTSSILEVIDFVKTEQMGWILTAATHSYDPCSKYTDLSEMIPKECIIIE